MYKLVVRIFCLLAIMNGCATVGGNTINGASFISDFSEGILATNLEGSKNGEACSFSILGIYSGGDASIEAAKKNGSISKVSSVSTKIFAVRPFYGRACTVITGN